MKCDASHVWPIVLLWIWRRNRTWRRSHLPGGPPVPDEHIFHGTTVLLIQFLQAKSIYHWCESVRRDDEGNPLETFPQLLMAHCELTCIIQCCCQPRYWVFLPGGVSRTLSGYKALQTRTCGRFCNVPFVDGHRKLEIEMFLTHMPTYISPLCFKPHLTANLYTFFGLCCCYACL